MNYLYWFSDLVFHLDSSYCRCCNLVRRLLSFLATPWNKAFFFFFFTELNTESNKNTTTWWKWRFFRLLLVWTKYSLWSGDGAFNGTLKEMNTLSGCEFAGFHGYYEKKLKREENLHTSWNSINTAILSRFCSFSWMKIYLFCVSSDYSQFVGA